MNDTNNGQVRKPKEKITRNNNPVKLLRYYYGLKQKQLADSIGVSISLIKKIESGVVPITQKNKSLIKEAFGLQDNWYENPNFDEEEHLEGPEKIVCEYITELIGNRKIAEEILGCIKNIVGAEGLSGEERKIYIQYVNKLMHDVNDIALDAIKYLKNNGMVEIENRVRKISKDIMNIPGYKIQRGPVLHEVSLTVNAEIEKEEIKLDF
jgi:transcriptional regulator with XRE-family HTH domain